MLLKAPFGAVRRLYNLEGVLINSLEELENNGDYVAAAQERYKPFNYANIPDSQYREMHKQRQVLYKFHR